MKKTALLLSLVASAFAADAQLALTGTSYTQSFDAIGGGLPTGWSAYVSATSSSLGTISSFNSSTTFGVFADTVTCAGIVFNEGFKNYPSANVVTKSATCAEQKLVANRAMGVRQVSATASPGFDPGAAFVLKIANTTGRKDFVATFKLQSLDTTSPRQTTWVVDYATGSSPSSFTPASAVGTLTTGSLVFSNNTINVNFGSALDGVSSNVWIRVVALTNTTGSGTRACTAIDDFNLTWTNTGVGVADVNSLASTSLNVLGNGTSNDVTFGINTQETSDYIFGIYDITGRNIRTETLNVQAGSQSHKVSGLNLAPGMYIAKMSNSNSSAVTKFVIN